MKKTKVILLIILSIVLSVIIYQYVMTLIFSFLDSNGVVYDHEISFNLSIFLICLFITFSSISMPIFLKYVYANNVLKKNIFKLILSLELFGLALAIFLTPPDAFSTVMVFIVWQIPVLINITILKIRDNK